MKWFQHDSNASQDAKIRKLVMKHGAEGYAIYFHCLELIAGTISKDNINFELEHDSEIIADNLKIKSDKDESAIDKVNRIMQTIIDLNLFECIDNRILCYKLAHRLDNTISRNPEINEIKAKLQSNNVDTTKLLQSSNKADKIRRDKIKSDKITLDKNKKDTPNKTKFLDFVMLSDKEHDELIKTLGKDSTKDFISRLNNYIGSKGKKYKSHYYTILSWSRKDSGGDKTGRIKTDAEFEEEYGKSGGGV